MCVLHVAIATAIITAIAGYSLANWLRLAGTWVAGWLHGFMAGFTLSISTAMMRLVEGSFADPSSTSPFGRLRCLYGSCFTPHVGGYWSLSVD